MTKKLEEIKVTMTSGIWAWLRKYFPILIMGGLSGFTTTFTSATINTNELDEYKETVQILEKEVDEQIIKTENLETRFVELRSDVREVRGDTRQILVILTGATNGYSRPTKDNTTSEDQER